MIPRSSYKFCGYNYECGFNYNLKKKGCFAQHYVHNMIYADVDATIKYLEKHKNSNNFVSEVKKSLNTISYVINHMYEEFKNVSSISKSQMKNNVEKVHKKEKKHKKKCVN